MANTVCQVIFLTSPPFYLAMLLQFPPCLRSHRNKQKHSFPELKSFCLTIITEFPIWYFGIFSEYLHTLVLKELRSGRRVRGGQRGKKRRKGKAEGKGEALKCLDQGVCVCVPLYPLYPPHTPSSWQGACALSATSVVRRR